MIPPDRGFKHDLKGQQSPPLSTMQKIVRYTEKDDLLLYVTAAFGIIMPAIMYFIYRTIHSKYHKYQEQKRKIERTNRKVARAKEPRTISMFYTPSDKIKKIVYGLAEDLENFDPVVKKLLSTEVAGTKLSAKSILIFVIERDKSKHLDEFLEWLDELRYEYRQKDFMRRASFLVVGVKIISSVDNSQPDKTSADGNEFLEVLHKRLKNLNGRPVDVPRIFNILDTVDKQCQSMEELSTTLKNLLRQFQFGAFDEVQNDVGSSVSEGDESGTTEEEKWFF